MKRRQILKQSLVLVPWIGAVAAAPPRRMEYPLLWLAGEISCTR